MAERNGTGEMPGKAGRAQSEAQPSAARFVAVGDVVGYVLGADGPGIGGRGEVRPAMVVRVWGDPPAAPYLIQLQVFMDGTNDDPVDGRPLSWRTSVPYSSGNEPGTWHHLPAVGARR